MQAVQEIKTADKAKAKPEGKPEAKELKPARAGALVLAESANNSWRYLVSAGVSADEIDMHPTFWNLLGSELTPGDDIKLICADRSWLGAAVCLDSGPGYACVKVIFSMSVPVRAVASTKQIPEGWAIVRADPGGPDGFVARHRGNGKTIDDSGLPFKTHEDARRGLLDHSIFRDPETTTRYLP
jgi:hypothetical protein